MTKLDTQLTYILDPGTVVAGSGTVAGAAADLRQGPPGWVLRRRRP
ncbi:hypothetical protein ACRAWD_13965 [Caulobacter segnis]